MKKMVLISFLGILSLGIVACDNQKKDYAEDAIKEFKSSYFKSCTGSGASLSFCECTYSEITKKYSEKDMIGIYTSNNKDSVDRLMNDVELSAKKCLK